MGQPEQGAAHIENLHLARFFRVGRGPGNARADRLAQRKAPSHETLTIDDVGAAAAFLVGDGARHITGNVTFIDCGVHVID